MQGFYFPFLFTLAQYNRDYGFEFFALANTFDPV